MCLKHTHTHTHTHTYERDSVKIYMILSLTSLAVPHHSQCSTTEGKFVILILHFPPVKSLSFHPNTSFASV